MAIQVRRRQGQNRSPSRERQRRRTRARAASPGAAKVDAPVLDGIVKALEDDQIILASVRLRASLLLRASSRSPGARTHQHPRRAVATGCSAVRSSELRPDLAHVFGAPINERGVWGVDVRSRSTPGEHLYQLNAGKLMMPASNMKILTLAAAAETLGWDYRFTTTLETRGPIDGRRAARRPRSFAATAIRRSTRAMAAPRAVFDEWARALTAAGITSDRRPHHRRRPGVRRRGARRRLGVGLPAVRLCRAGRARSSSTRTSPTLTGCAGDQSRARRRSSACRPAPGLSW